MLIGSIRSRLRMCIVEATHTTSNKMVGVSIFAQNAINSCNVVIVAVYAHIKRKRKNTRRLGTLWKRKLGLGGRGGSLPPRINKPMYPKLHTRKGYSMVLAGEDALVFKLHRECCPCNLSRVGNRKGVPGKIHDSLQHVRGDFASHPGLRQVSQRIGEKVWSRATPARYEGIGGTPNVR